jgi:hypothetical protein
MDGPAEFRGLACGTHARNIRRSIAPYSYGLAARARRIYNDVACSGGAGRSFITTNAATGGHEARTPRHSGPRLLLKQRPIGFIGTVTPEKRKRRTRSLDLRADDHCDPKNCKMISRATITRMILRTIPLIALPASPV